ncbi:hypothetical protein NGK36_21040 [Hafnia alvei]|uniref:hypothetical protein n=1 Tax=Hafnia alvei TaxID=569 RepID=UPI00242F84EF|nr:hypothetical protein [Hafnia alvei]MEB7891751.1 hypothetical protein [Hafnia alvei]
MKNVTMDKLNISTLVSEGDYAPYFQEVSVISSCTYMSQGLVYLCQSVKCVARPYLIDFFSANYLSEDSATLTSKKLFTPYHHYVVHVSMGQDTMFADLMALIVITNNLPLTSTITILSELPPDFIYHTLHLNLHKRVTLTRCRWICAKSPPSYISATIPCPSRHSMAVMLERGGGKTAENSRYIGLTCFEINVLMLFFRYPHPGVRNVKMRSKQFHHHKLSGLRKLSQLPGKEGQVFAGLIHSKKKSPCTL